MTLITDILLLSSAASFLIGFLSLFMIRIRIKQKSRFYFLLAMILFGLSLTLGWSDFVAGFNYCAVE